MFSIPLLICSNLDIWLRMALHIILCCCIVVCFELLLRIQQNYNKFSKLVLHVECFKKTEYNLANRFTLNNFLPTSPLFSEWIQLSQQITQNDNPLYLIQHIQQIIKESKTQKIIIGFSLFHVFVLTL